MLHFRQSARANPHIMQDKNFVEKNGLCSEYFIRPVSSGVRKIFLNL